MASGHLLVVRSTRYLGDPHIPLPQHGSQGGGGARGVWEEEVERDLIRVSAARLNIHWTGRCQSTITAARYSLCWLVLVWQITGGLLPLFPSTVRLSEASWPAVAPQFAPQQPALAPVALLPPITRLSKSRRIWNYLSADTCTAFIPFIPGTQRGHSWRSCKNMFP